MELIDYLIKGHQTGTNQIKGYGRNDLAKLFNRLGFKRGVEIGTEAGKYAQVLLQSIEGLHLTCIDPWSVYDDGGGYKEVNQKQYDDYYRATQDRVKGYNCDLLRMTSQEGIKVFPDESLDFVYIDGNHRLDYVTWDIVNWAEKVKKGGIVAGHDYIKLKEQHYSHVPYAVDAYCQAYFINTLYVLDNKSSDKTPEENQKYDRIRSWFFVKV